jgi:hypothetical protein
MARPVLDLLTTSAFYTFYAGIIAVMFLVAGPQLKALSRNPTGSNTGLIPTDHHQGVAMAAASMTTEATFVLSMMRRAALSHPTPLDSGRLLTTFGFAVFSFICLVGAAYSQRLADALYQKEVNGGEAFCPKRRRALAIRSNLLGLAPLVSFTAVVRGL